jgi:regulator of nonsense transcripts 2
MQAATEASKVQCESKITIRLSREANAAPSRPANEDLSKLESSIKRNGTLTKKLRGLTADTCDSVLNDIRATNQSRFMTEAAAALVDAVTRPSRVAPAIKARSANLSRLDGRI